MRIPVIGFGFLSLSAGCVSHPFATPDNEICSAVIELAAYAVSSDTQVKTVLSKSGAELGCGYSPPDAVQSYCSVVLENSSFEFVNGYPWAIKKCVEKYGVLSKAEVTDEWTGLGGERSQKIVGLAGVLKSGVHIILSFEPDAEPNSDNYYGRYSLTLTPVKSDL